MARQQMVSYTVTCDVCGEEITDGDPQAASRKITWEGADYLVDMCAADQAALGSVLGQLRVFVDAGRQDMASRGPSRRSASKASAGGRRPGASSKSGSITGRSDMPIIRAWALENGHQVGHRGRIPADVVAAYDQAQSSEPAESAPKRRRSHKAPRVRA